jgi:hypothetical protein
MFREAFMKAELLLSRMLAIGLCAISLTAVSAPRERPLKLLGQPAAATQATRTIVIKPNTKYVRVASGETVKFVSSDKDFTWHFDGPEGPFALSQIAPRGMLDRPIKGYVDPNPQYLH